MKILAVLILSLIGFQGFSMTEVTTKKSTIEMTTESASSSADRKKRINKKRKRKCSKWGKHSFAG